MKITEVRLSDRAYARLEKIAQANSISPDDMVNTLIENISDTEVRRILRGFNRKNFEVNRTTLFMGAMFLVGMLLAVLYILFQVSP